MSSYVVPFARIDWSEGGPRSVDRGDIYFSKDGAIAEAEHVFLRGTDIERRLSSQTNITVGELGFGFGLNFLLTWRAFEQSGSDGFLLYLSFENSLVHIDDLKRFYLRYPELSGYADRLIEILPGNFKGSFRLSVTEKVSLQLIIGDAKDSLSQLQSGVVDSWYLDGFAPALNPELWTNAVVTQLARLSEPGTTLASYSVAAQFRRDLGELGFEVTKAPGFGKKRECLSAVFRPQSNAATKTVRPNDGRIAVIGGGLAAIAMSSALARRSVKHSLIFRGQEIGDGASGNLFGILMPHVSLQPSPMADFFLAGFFAAISEISRMLKVGDVAGELKGVLRLTTSDRLARLHEELSRLGLPEEFVTELSGGLFFGRGGYVSPLNMSQTMLESARSHVEQVNQTEVEDLEWTGESWIVKCKGGVSFEVDTVCLGQGYESLPFISKLNTPIEKVRGQVAVLRQKSFSGEIKFPICYDGYITPAPQGEHLLGGTFDHNDERENSDELQTADLLSRLQQNVPLCKFNADDVLNTRVSFRAMTPDRLPIVGPLFDPERFEQSFRAGGLRELPTDETLPNLFTITGLGSKGLISAHLGAEIIVSRILNEPPPIMSKLLAAVNPARFFARAIKRGENV